MLVAKETNLGVAVFIADITSMCGFGSDGAAYLPTYCVLVCPLLQPSVCLPPVLRCCFRALLHFVQPAAMPSQDIVSMSTAFTSRMQTILRIID